MMMMLDTGGCKYRLSEMGWAWEERTTDLEICAEMLDTDFVSRDFMNENGGCVRKMKS